MQRTLHKDRPVIRQTSLWSCNKIGVFDIGEKPRVGIPSSLMKRASVVEAKISGFASFPPAAVIACLKTDHQGFESFVRVIRGHPLQSLNGPSWIICINMWVINTSFHLDLVNYKENKRRKIEYIKTWNQSTSHWLSTVYLKSCNYYLGASTFGLASEWKMIKW